MPVKIIIVDDDFIERSRLVKLLSYCDPINYEVYQCESDNAVKLVEELRPSIIFMEIIMKMDSSGFDIVNSIISSGLNATIIYVHKSDKYAIKAIRNHAFDYLVKPVNIDELKKCLSRFLNENNSIENSEVLDISKLSSREIDVLKQLINGLSSKEIAQKLNISINTVNSHRSSLLKKCNVKNVVELMNKSRNLFI